MNSHRPSLVSACFLVGFVAFLARLVHWWSFSQVALVQVPQVDGSFYHQWAVNWARGLDPGLQSIWAAPGYPHWVGWLYQLLGPEPLRVAFLQHCLGVISTLLLLRILWRFFSPGVALLSGLLWAVYPLRIFYESLLLPTSLLEQLSVVFLALLLWSNQRREALVHLLVGVVWGLLCTAKGHYLYFGVLPLIFCRRGVRERLLFIAGIGVMIFPVLLRNFLIFGEPILLSAHGGEAVYIGNNPESDGLYNPLYASHDKVEGHARKKREAEEAVGHRLSYREADRYWSRKALDFAWEQPGRFLWLLGQKTSLALHRTELPNNYDYRYLRRLSLSLHWNPLHWGLVLPSGLLGLLCLFWEKKREDVENWRVVLCLLAVNCAALWIVFSTSRYRMPALPFFWILATLGCYELFQRLKDRERHKQGWILVFLLLGLGLVCNWPRARLEQNLHWTPLQEARLELGRERLSHAHAALKSVLEISPESPEAWELAAQVLLRKKRTEEAFSILQRLAQSHPESIHIQISWIRLLLDLQRCEQARAYIRSALSKGLALPRKLLERSSACP